MRLKITQRARVELARRIARSHFPERAGLRISRRPGTDRFLVAMTHDAAPSDVVVEGGDVRVYCGPVAANRLDGKTLDVRDDAVGRLRFVSHPDRS